MGRFHWQNAVDFFALTAVLYGVFRWARSARALRLALSILGLHTLALVARHFDLLVTSWILDGLAIFTIVLLLVTFQSELRSVFMRLDTTLSRWPKRRATVAPRLQAIADAAFELARERIGALIVRCPQGRHFRTHRRRCGPQCRYNF